MLSPSDFNNAVPQFTNGNYASNPINPQYIAEPDAVHYNRGAEPLQTLPAQWWNWFLNKFTSRFNKVNIYVNNIFNELSQLLSVVSESPSGTEAEPTVGQLKDMFETKYPDYLKDTDALSNTYVPQTTKVNGHALSGDVTVTCVACAGANGSGTAFGTAATVNTGTAVGCIPTVGTALGTTDGQFLATDASGNLKPSGYSASSFRSSTWTPSSVSCASTISRTGFTDAYNFDILLTNGSSTATGTTPYVSNKCRLQFCSTTGVLSAVCFNGLATRAGYATCLYNRQAGASKVSNVYFYTSCTSSTCVATNFDACICGANGCLYNIGGINLAVTGTNGCKSKAIGSTACTDSWEIYGCVGGSDQYNLIMDLKDDGSNYVGFACNGTVKSYICGNNGTFYGTVCGNVCGTASSAVSATYAASAGYATCLYNRLSGKNCVGNVYFFTNCTNASCATTNYSSCICGVNGYYYGNICGNVYGTATNATNATNACNSKCLCGAVGTCYLKTCGCNCVYIDKIYSCNAAAVLGSPICFGSFLSTPTGVCTVYTCISGCVYHGNVCGNICGTASKAINAGNCYCDDCVFFCVQGNVYCSCCSDAISYGYICNKNSTPVIFTMPIPNCMIPSSFCVCGYSNKTMYWYDRIEGPPPMSLVQIEGNSSKSICWYVCYNRMPSASCTKIPYRLLGYSN